ncbi:TrbC/VirB2 family protein [Thermoflavimicrobium dichotomicum]|uniref:TrbC/VIRB2 family protein n=1 Tax=Thermoflavimicrobium dichotomicum TaxID=46223 RepID=A0A1I3K787_9BACL|nr:TrbC/VirB2 family protein [Thermoflavimicrobium dichotomicum]SFI68190.1 TrbC/VIRB2 family protein [Thermoflavimicrobium dichotomicum]
MFSIIQEKINAKLLVLAENPFDSVANFLQQDVVGGMLKLITPIAIVGIIITGLGALLSTDENSKTKFKQGLIWTVAATAVCFLAQGIVTWIQSGIK